MNKIIIAKMRQIGCTVATVKTYLFHMARIRYWPLAARYNLAKHLRVI